MTHLSPLEAFGYEYGTVLQSSACIFASQLFIALLLAISVPLPGTLTFWLFLLYLLASVMTVAKDLHFYQSTLPDPLSQHVRTCLDIVFFVCTSDFLLVGDNANSSKAHQIAQRFIQKLGGALSALFFPTALFLANCAFIAAFRLLINLILTCILIGKEILEYFCPRLDRQSSMNTMSNS